jgi:Holliday junction resolvasome RuvABC endonuclease subunit
MPQKTIKIIGINPGTRYLGIAVLYGQELMDWRIKVLDGKWSNRKITRARGILAEAIGQYKLNALVIKKLSPARRSENLFRLTNKLKEFARRAKIRVSQYSIKEIENAFIYDGKLNKRNLAEAMVELYPILHHDLIKERKHKNTYYFRMFEAVALASACSQKLGES